VVGSGVILLYHRIATLPSDPQLLAVTPAHFNEHLEVLRDAGVPMSLSRLLGANRERRLPPRAVAVTFDDGYADNFDEGGPLLARHDVPATVFVTTAYVGGEAEFWWDDLERLLLGRGSFPPTLRLRIGDAVHQWDLGDAACCDDTAVRRDRGWNVECRGDPTPRHRAYRDLCELLRRVSGDDRPAVIDDLTRLAGATSAGRQTHRPVSRERIARASADALIEVGAHTVTHSMLAALPPAAQRSEIADSKAAVRDITGADPAGFSYPFGSRSDYTRTTVALVQEAGFRFACANVPGGVSPKSDSWQLPRLLVRDWDGETFARRLQEHLAG